MNTINLIRAGAMAQKRFHMLADFGIMLIPANAGNTYRVAIHPNIEFSYRKEDYAYVPIDYDDVRLEIFIFRNTLEHIMMGYSERANVLVVKN